MAFFEDTILESIQSLLGDACCVLLAVSGGADSVAIVHVLVELKKQRRLSCEFVIGHVNHCLRGKESDADGAFVKELGDRMGVEVVTEAVDVRAYAKERKLSIETAGRMVRLKTLAVMAAEHNCDCIATAHHKDDLAETIIHRLMRGTGFRGLSGIRPQSRVYGAQFIRPMLNVRRHEIVQYCKDNHIPWREDASNREMTFTRNRIRHRLLPALNSETIFDQLAALSCKSWQFLLQTEQQARSIFDAGQFNKDKNNFTLNQDILHGCPPWVFYEVVRQGLVKLKVGLRNYTQSHFESIREMVSQNKARADFPGGVEVVVNSGIVSIHKETKTPVFPDKPFVLEVGQSIQFGPWRVSCELLRREDVDVEHFFRTKDAFVEWLDADQIIGSLTIRSKKNGDRFWPIGAGSEKKVARFLQDAQLDTQTKRDVFIISDGDEILWLAPVRMSEKAKITNKTVQVLEVRLG